MFIPYAVDAPFDHRPVVNWLVILGIILVFVLQVATSEKQVAEKSKKGIESPIEEVLRVPTVENEVATKQVEKKQAVTGPMARFALNGWGIGLFTYIWLHGGILKGTVRLIGNLIFLWPFGNAVCAKLGNKLYLLVYLGFGLLAGVTHLLLGVGPAIGACGVISGIVGIYIVLFPEDTISCFFLLPRPMAVSISGYWVVALWFVFDLLEAGLGSPGTTYYAHILCAGAGVGLAVLMLKKKWLVMESDEKSLLQMLSRKEKEEEKGKEEGEKKGEKEEKKDLEAVEKQLKTADRKKAEPKKTVPEVEKPEDDFVRFRCECGHRIKLYKKDAGKTGRCPKCLRWVEAPRK
jgi:membrane associated rhomboid family serine protease